MSLHFQRKLEEARRYLLSQEFAAALPQYESLIRQDPAVPAVWLEYGNVAARLRRTELAERAWKKAIELNPRDSELISLVGHQYEALRNPAAARACFARAAAADPRAINPRISLAVLLEQTHQLDQARRVVEECLALDPRDDQARYFAAVLDRREQKLEEAERRLRDLIRSEPNYPYVRYACRYELAQVLDRTGRYSEAMGLLAEAKSLVRALTDTEAFLKSYDQSAEAATRFTKTLPKDTLRAWAKTFPEGKRESIPCLALLGGHPRSGTTLLEEVLDAHPGVAALDEPTAFLEVLQPAFYRSSNHSIGVLNGLRRRYIEALSREVGPSAGKLLVDKNPSPTARLPIWLKVFPELRVLIALRDPRDVALSCYFQNIPLNTTNVNFLSLERVAKHYADLMDIWLTVREWEGFAWLETRYESLVTDLETEGRRVTEFLGLAWDPAQKQFYEKSRGKQLYSPTYQDVTTPVYTRSLGRWRAYEEYLAPIFPALDRFCRAFGYQ
jgi:Tfp pilus assembly protein PilF